MPRWLRNLWNEVSPWISFWLFAMCVIGCLSGIAYLLWMNFLRTVFSGLRV